MQKAKMSAKKLLKILLSTISAFIFGCATLPPWMPPPPQKPVLTLCVVDYPANQAICGETSFKTINSLREFSYNNVILEILNSPVVRRESLESLDKAVAFRPAEWEKSENYREQTEDYIKNYCGK